MPALDYVPKPCGVCGAETEDEAANRCKLTSDETGERYCMGGAEANSLGVFVAPTAESQARLDAWYNELTEEDERLHATPPNPEG
jgi:hypothetical protein